MSTIHSTRSQHRTFDVLLAFALALGVWLIFYMQSAQADDFYVYSPYVVQGQSELEFLGHSYQDSDPAVSGEYAYQFSAAHAFTSWWKPEIYFGVYQHSPGGPQTLVAREFENTFQLTAPGEYCVDMGFLASFEYATQPGETSVLEFGPLFEKHVGHYVQKLNFIWEKQIGGGADNMYAFRTAYSLSYQLRAWLAPGAEIYLRPHDNAYQIGPVLYGELVSSKGSELEYSAGVVFGANPGAPNQTLVLRLEYEFY